MNKEYIYTNDMGEISGFGGNYEETCRRMVIAGIKWFDEHLTADPIFKGFKNVFGLLMEDNEDAKALSKAMTDPPNNDCTGAMHQAAINHVLFIKRNGWEKYCEEMKKEIPCPQK